MNLPYGQILTIVFEWMASISFTPDLDAEIWMKVDEKERLKCFPKHRGKVTTNFELGFVLQ